MVLALLSDIHGNRVALEAVLRDVQAEMPDGVVCLGDVAGWGPQPRECVRRVASLGCSTVMGNSDAWLLAPEAYVNPSVEQKRVEEIEWWCREQLEPEDFGVLRGFEPTVTVELGEDLTVLCCHGSPRSFHESLRSETPEGDLDSLLAGVGAAVVAAGHTHVPMVRRYRETLVVNPGSVGMPYVRLAGGGVRNPAWAEYALLRVRDKQLEVLLRRVPVDVDELAEVTLNSGMPHAAEWLADRR